MVMLFLWLQSAGDPTLGHLNQYPLFGRWLTAVYQPISQSRGFNYRITQRYTAMNFADSGPDWRYDMDMEISQWMMDASLRRGAYEFMVSVSASMQWGGFMDPFLNDYHKALGLPNYNRNGQPENRHSFLFRDADEDFWSVRSGVWMAEAPVFSVHRHGKWPVSISVKPPLATAKTWDLAAETRFAAGNAFGSVGGVMRQKRDEDPYSSVRSMPTFRAGYWAKPGKLTFVAEVSTHPPFYEGTGLPKLEKQTIELVLGGHIPTRWGRLTLSFSEDLSYTAPDFTIGIRWTPELLSKSRVSSVN